MKEKTCCVTGHREISEDKLAYVENELKKAVMAAVKDGYTRFINGGAAGADLLFVAVVAELREQGYPIFLEAALPYRSRLNSRDPAFQTMISACDRIKVLCEKSLRSCYHVRNRYMVDESDLVIVYDGRDTGGIVYTMNYAQDKGKTVQVISI